jgi:hypothetical protein
MHPKQSLKRGILPALALFLGLLSSCRAPSPITGQSLLAFSSSGPRSLSLILSRDSSSILGAWEEAALSRHGLVEGDSKADGSVTLRFFGATTKSPVGLFEGRYEGGEKAIAGRLGFGTEQAIELSFTQDPAPTAPLRQLSAQAQSREGLSATASEPSRFYYVGFEPRKPGAFQSWYRKAFEGSMSLSKAIETEKKTFLGDAKTAAAADPASAQAWFYDGHQILTYRNDRLLVMGLRLSVYSGGGGPQSSLRFAVMDPVGLKRLGPGDFLQEKAQARLSGLLAESLREEIGLPAGASLSSAGFLADQLPPSPDFFVYSKGLGFHYPPAAFAPEAEGELFILLPFDRLGEVLKPGILETYGLGGGSKG